MTTLEERRGGGELDINRWYDLTVFKDVGVIEVSRDVALDLVYWSAVKF